jgi:hypothetical protein
MIIVFPLCYEPEVLIRPLLLLLLLADGIARPTLDDYSGGRMAMKMIRTPSS